MRIRYLSDLHTEFYNLVSLNSKLLMRLKSSKDEVCVCAGDIGSIIHSRKNYDITMTYLSKQFKQVFVINGNHEYYNSEKTMEQVDAEMAAYFEEKAFPNVQWLNNRAYTYEGVTFIGTTLWTHVSPSVPEINDTKCIPGLTRELYNGHHQRCREWLRAQVPLPPKSVIITHHMPSPQLVADKYQGAAINPWFHCNMEKFIENNKNNIACWIYGHTHTASETHISGVPMLCNPLGYPGENKWPSETSIILV